MLPKIKPSQTNVWKKLNKHHKDISNIDLKTLFEQDNKRFEKYSLQLDDIFVDFSKNIINKTTLNLLTELAEKVGLPEAIENYFSGEPINETEGRSVLHTALRSPKDKLFKVNDQDITSDVQNVLKKIKKFSKAVESGNWKGLSDKGIKNIVNIGIGGSDLAPVMITRALEPYQNHIKLHFISNIDSNNLVSVLKKLDPETTLFIIASKTFTTQETITNANSVKSWFLESIKNLTNDSKEAVKKHFVAVSTNRKEVEKFGIDSNNMFPFWDWVGGRFSWASSIGLSIACSVGFNNFKCLLEGAHSMDEHFKNTKLKKNIPVVLALLNVWYTNFFNSQTEAILPYSHYLRYLPDYLQQMCMESNGKSTDRTGKKVNYHTGNIIWGGVGTNAQHSFFQLLHQGTQMIPCDFLISAKADEPKYQNHHDILMSNFLAQTQALMQGKTLQEAEEELVEKLNDNEKIKTLLPYKIFEGNRPSNSIIYKKLTPKVLGSLIAMYEHKVFVQGIIWNIYSFDQWGVELGKQLANEILDYLKKTKKGVLDSSTKGLITLYKEWSSDSENKSLIL